MAKVAIAQVASAAIDAAAKLEKLDEVRRSGASEEEIDSAAQKAADSVNAYKKLTGTD